MSDIQLYHPLEAGQIRVLTIVAINRTIHCRLELSSLSQTSTNWHPYNALSYVWGSEPFSETILCNGKPLNITPSLSGTLRQLFAYEDESSEQHPIWIDAICLNQLDSAEMEAQVPLMREIFSKASVVLVYLGRAQGDSDLAMASATDLKDRLQAIDGVLVYAMLPGLGIEDHRHPVWYAIECLFDRPWFSRVWTLQEAVLAKKIMVGCGSKWLPWEALVDLIVELRRLHIHWLVERDATKRALEIGALPGATALLQINSFRKSYDPERGLPITDLLECSRGRVCKEPVHIGGITHC